MSEPGAATNAEDQAPVRPERDAPVRVLVVDDESGVRNAIARVLRNAGMLPSTADGGASALALLEREPFDVALVDVRMPGMTGPQLLAHMKAHRHPAEVIMMTAFADVATTVSVLKEGAYGFLTKPFSANESIVIEVLNAAGHKRLRERAERLQRELADLRPAEMIGVCPQMREVNRVIAGVAKSDAHVIVVGESGTGKELVARAVHSRSRRAAKPLIVIDCAAIPEELVEGELFGYAGGVFPAASSNRPGLFETASNGTLFLDSVDDLPAGVRSKLLQVLDSGRIEPIGGGSEASKHVDVRVIVATQRAMPEVLTPGSFIENLFARLDIVTVHLPPLRERDDDVLRLAQHFLQKHAELVGRSPPRLGADAVLCLTRYGWPGNVRELEHAIERALFLDDSGILAASSFPPEISTVIDDRPSGELETQAATMTPREAASPSTPPRSIEDAVAALALHELEYNDAKRRVLADFTEAYVAALLRITGGNVSEAARRSGLDRSNFRRLVRTRTASIASLEPSNEE
ncbi:MAG: Response regulator of zinc sigma-54-dependent two-component system, partial [Labilithrix sp.]|nr:Response regulator of zinc sigma-54-dependent two-component system [Labilithrix sp.]